MGAKVIDRLAADLRAAFPEQRGWSRRNLPDMRAMAEAWTDGGAFVHQGAAHMPWTHVTALLDRLTTAAEREWYATQAVEHGLSRAVLGAARSRAVSEWLPLRRRRAGLMRRQRAGGTGCQAVSS